MRNLCFTFSVLLGNLRQHCVEINNKLGTDRIKRKTTSKERKKKATNRIKTWSK